MASAVGFGNLVGNFLQAFSQSRTLSQRSAADEEERKARTKLFEIQLRKEQEQQAASDRITAALSPQSQGAEFAGTGPQQAPPQLSVSQLLADPARSLDLLKSGMFGQLASFSQAQRGQEFQDQLLNMLGGQGGGQPGQQPSGMFGGMEVTGVGIGPNGQLMPDFGLPPVTTQTVQTPAGARIRSINPRTGATVAELGAPPDKSIDVNEAGRLQGLFGAQELVQSLKSGFLNANGSVNRQAVLSSFGPGVPWTEGRTLSSQFEDAADAIIRARTGATANVEEIQGIARQFKPNPLDSDTTIKDKLARFERFSSGALDAVTLPPRLRALADKAGAALGNFEGFEIVDD